MEKQKGRYEQEEEKRILFADHQREEATEQGDQQVFPPQKRRKSSLACPRSLSLAKIRKIPNLQILVALPLYMLVGPTLILVNRNTMKDLKFKFPFTISALGLIGAGILSCILVHGTKTVQLEKKDQVTKTFVVKNLIPIGMCTTGTLSFGNTAYLYLGVGLIQILKAFTPVITCFFMAILCVEKPSWLVVLSLIGLSCSMALATGGSADVNIFGVLTMLLAETCEAIRLVLQQKLFKKFSFGITEGLYYMAPISTFFLLVAASFIEFPKMIYQEKYKIFLSHPGHFALSIVLGAMVNYMGSWLIQLTNSVTLKVLNIARSTCLIIYSVVVYNEEITNTEFVGYALCVLFLVAYNYSYRLQKNSQRGYE